MPPEPTQLLDPSFDRVAALLSELDYEKAQLVADDYLMAAIERVSKEYPAGSLLQYDRAFSVVKSLHDVCSRAMVEHARRYPKLRWHWYARRLPSTLFAGDLPSTEGMVRGLFETACCLGGTEQVDFDTDPQTGGMCFPLTSEIGQDLLLVASLARRLHSLQATLRWVGKAAPVEIIPFDAPQARPSRDLTAAVREYDERVHRQLPQFTRLGTIMSSAIGGPAGLVPLAALWRLSRPTWTTLRYDQFTGARTEILARYNLTGVYFAGVLALLNDDRLDSHLVWNATIASLVVALHAAYLLHTQRFRDVDSSYSTGYMLVRSAEFVTLIEGVAQLINSTLAAANIKLRVPSRFDELLKGLTGSGSLWPLRPLPVVLETAQGYLFDIATANQRLFSELEYPDIQGDVANLRAEHFELGIQSAIDVSPWRPPEEWRALRGRTLTLDGTALTDIDAVGCRDGTVLIVSCKSIRNSASYSAGDWRAVRSAATRVVSAVAEIASTMKTLRSRASDITPPLPTWARIEGIVCTPHVFFTGEGDATAIVLPGLRRAASASELYLWLHESASTSATT